jgi:hypothetical protein
MATVSSTPTPVTLQAARDYAAGLKRALTNLGRVPEALRGVPNVAGVTRGVEQAREAAEMLLGYWQQQVKALEAPPPAPKADPAPATGPAERGAF